MAKTVAVIGAGISGLLSAKACKEAGLSPVVYESSTHVGGIWSSESRYLPQHLTTNMSRYIFSFSDFPWRSDPSEPPVPTFPTAAHVGLHCKRYSDRFLPNCISLNTKVILVRFETERGQWRVQYCKGNDEPAEAFHDYLIVSSGFFSKPFIPKIPGLSNKSNVYHYSDAEIQLSQGSLDVTGKSVVVVGGSVSGVELAGNLYHYNPKKVVHITKKSICILPLYLPEDPSALCPSFVPVDIGLMARLPPPNSMNQLDAGEKKQFGIVRLQKFVGDQSSISAKLKITEDDPPFIAFSNSYAESVRSGGIEVVRGELVSVQDSDLHVARGTSIEKITFETDDNPVIIFGSGYSTELPFFDEEALKSIDFDPSNHYQPVLLANAILNPNFPQAAFVGIHRGPFFALVELQAKYAASLFAKSIPWPQLESLRSDISDARQLRSNLHRSQFTYPVYADAVRAHVRWSNLYERPNEGYALPSKFCASTEAREILDTFHSDLKAMRSGRYIPATIFRNLIGTWVVESHTEETCEAKFVRSITQGAVSCNTCVYMENNEHLETYRYDANAETLFVNTKNASASSPINFTPDVELGWRGNVSIVDFDGIKYTVEFLFPFEGVYCNSFTKRVVRFSPNASSSDIVTRFTRK